MQQPTQEITFERRGGEVSAILTLTTPSGAVERFVGVIDDANMDELAEELDRLEGADVTGCLCEDEVGAAKNHDRYTGFFGKGGVNPKLGSLSDYETHIFSGLDMWAPLWWWHAIGAKASGKKVTDEAARIAWWKRKSHDEMERDIASYRGIADQQNPRTKMSFIYSPDEALKWWGGLTATRRTQIKNRYIINLANIFWRGRKKIGKGALQLAPVALAMIPGVGLALGPAAAAALAVAQKIASSKAVAMAAQSLEAAAKAKGAAPPAIAAQLKATGAFTMAQLAADVGKPTAAKKIAEKAKQHVIKSVPGNLGAGILAIANATRKNLEKVTGGKPPGAAAAIAPAVLTNARKGLLRSNRKGAVTVKELAAAQDAGRVFLVKSTKGKKPDVMKRASDGAVATPAGKRTTREAIAKANGKGRVFFVLSA